MHKVAMFLILVCTLTALSVAQAVEQPAVAMARSITEYKLLATNKTSTTQKELNEAADAGFRFGGVMGGKTAFGGQEVVTIMTRPANNPEKGRFAYKLLATNKTS